MEKLQILKMDASSIATAIKKKQITSVEAVTVFIERIKEINPSINAVVEDRFSEALQEAHEADEQLQNNKSVGRLHGVPISIKECLHVKGMKTTGGLEHRQDLIYQEDAEVVDQLKQEGAIILGKTNTPALCFCQETDNKLYGRTNNPWDPTKTAGGSSGGEGALLAAGGAAVGIGSDVGGPFVFQRILMVLSASSQATLPYPSKDISQRFSMTCKNVCLLWGQWESPFRICSLSTKFYLIRL